VPGISETMTLSSFIKMLKSEDFPTFVLPKIVNFIPSIKGFSSSYFDKIVSISFKFLVNISWISSSLTSSTSSGKEIEPSIFILNVFKSSIISFTFFVNLPSSVFIDDWSSYKSLEKTILFIACAEIRSILPFKNALSVNSPGLDNLPPYSIIVVIILSIRTGEEKVWISTTSSPV